MRVAMTFGTYLLAVLCADLTLAEERGPAQSAERVRSQSGFDDMPQFGGPTSVSGALIENDLVRDAVYEFDVLKPWFDWKARIQDDYGVAFGVSLYTLYQNATDARASEDDDGWGSIFRLSGTWTLMGQGSPNAGRIEWRVENRSDLGGLQSPQELGAAIGAAALNPGFGYSSNFNTDLAVINWTQISRDGTAGFTLGRLAYDAYLDSMPFQTTNRGFLNRGFLLNPTVGTTGIGALGAVAKGFLTDNIFVGAHIYDGNAVSGEFDWDTVDEHEYLKAVEFGWAPSVEPRLVEKVTFTYWDKDARKKAGVPSGHGWAVSGSWKIGEPWLTFIRFGHSDGGAGVSAENALSGGFEYAHGNDRVWTLGVAWAEPTSRSSDDDEYAVEASYEFQLAKNLAVLTDVQLILDPAINRSEDQVWVFGLRVFLTL